MLRVIFDTNIYGWLIKEKNHEILRKKILEDSDLIIYGFSLIRNELRNVPKGEKFGRLSKRNYLICVYDELTKGRYLRDSSEIRGLAMEFYGTYRKFGGIRNWKKTNIDVDFSIIACACVNNLDIVITNDSKTMLSEVARKAYKNVINKKDLKLPRFWKYSDMLSRY